MFSFTALPYMWHPIFCCHFTFIFIFSLFLASRVFGVPQWTAYFVCSHPSIPVSSSIITNTIMINKRPQVLHNPFSTFFYLYIYFHSFKSLSSFPLLLHSQTHSVISQGLYHRSFAHSLQYHPSHVSSFLSAGGHHVRPISQVHLLTL